jgi:hypothetical protein
LSVLVVAADEVEEVVAPALEDTQGLSIRE